jgi:hypothetical protein
MILARRVRRISRTRTGVHHGSRYIIKAALPAMPIKFPGLIPNTRAVILTNTVLSAWHLRREGLVLVADRSFSCNRHPVRGLFFYRVSS